MMDIARTKAQIEALWNKGDLDVIESLYADNFVGHDPQNPVEGRDGVRAWYEEVKASAPDIHLNIDEIVAAGDMIASRWTVSGTDTGGWRGVPPTNQTWVINGMTMSKFHDDQIVESWSLADNLGLLQQMGLVPEISA